MADDFKDKRILGDEWEDWDGSIEEQIDMPKRLFLGFAFLGILLIIAFLFLQWYLIKPRLDQFSPAASDIFLIGVIIFSVFVILISAFIFTALFLGKGVLPSWGKSLIIKSTKQFLPMVFNLAGKFGISLDKLGNSFVKVHNAVTSAFWGSKIKGKTIVIAPRCLSKENRDELKKIAEKYAVEMFNVAGGSAALKIVQQKCPSSVIGIACERDLVNGIKEVDSRIAVIGIPNIRPEGPCKNTCVDTNYFENILKLFSGKA